MTIVNGYAQKEQVQADWNETNSSSKAYIQNKPTIPAAQVNSDWNAVSGVSQILNKPTIPAAQVQSNWNESNSASMAYIQNKPTIPTISKGTISIASGDWSSLACTKTVAGLSGNTIILSPAPASYSDYIAAGIYVSSESGNNITFTCTTAPSSTITLNYVVI